MLLRRGRCASRGESALSSVCAAVGPPTGRTLAGSGPKPGELAAAVTSAVENEIRPSND